jgi:hypothetical protein
LKKIYYYEITKLIGMHDESKNILR